MFKKSFALISLVWLVSFFSVGYASSLIPANRTITNLVTYKHYAVVFFSPAASGSELGENCAQGSENRVVLNFEISDGSSPIDTRQQYASLLAAYIAGRNSVGFAVSGCRVGNGNNYPLIYRLQI